MKILTPIKPMLVEYAAGQDAFDEILQSHGGSTFAELKYDGYRIQLHKKAGIVKAFTRNMNEVPIEAYPELSSSIRNLPDCILDCELNGGLGHKGFQNVQKRFKFKMPKCISYSGPKLELKVFDVLNFNNEFIIDLPLEQRREYTEKIRESRIRPSLSWKIDDAKSLDELFNEVTSKGNEGLVCKNPESLYIPGYRGAHWAKLKKSETLDLVLLGLYMGKKGISQFLCGTYNPERECYEPLCTVNAKREGLNSEVAKRIKPKKTKPRNVDFYYFKKDELPDLYIHPNDSLVLEIKAMNILRGKNHYSCGHDGETSFSLRIGWVKGIRNDKKSYDATTTEMIEELYKKQEAM